MAIDHHHRRRHHPTSAAVYDQECDPDLSGGWPPLHRGCARTPRPSPRHRPPLFPPPPPSPPDGGGGVQPAAAARRREQTRAWLVITRDWRLSGWLLWTCGGVVFWLHCRCVSPSFLSSSFALEGMRRILHLFVGGGGGWNYDESIFRRVRMENGLLQGFWRGFRGSTFRFKYTRVGENASKYIDRVG